MRAQRGARPRGAHRRAVDERAYGVGRKPARGGDAADELLKKAPAEQRALRAVRLRVALLRKLLPAPARRSAPLSAAARRRAG